jgi:hypothetical protein
MADTPDNTTQPDILSCATCQEPATYVGTEYGIRVYLCLHGHLTRVRPPRKDR